ncbi:hypothetical protein [Streptomyces specialis]|uniref:hypothetical protein n=1 Tax=Streptomyces specialis TaxID=498367 RepID=UPI00073F2B8E|nr:hypothetical protein [Streptomyces specialis]
MAQKIQKTVIPGSGRRVGETLRKGKTEKTIEALVEKDDEPAYKLKATYDDRRPYTDVNITVVSQAGKTEIWNREARPSWYWELVAAAVAKMKDTGTADLDRLQAAYTALFAALKAKNSALDVKMLPGWSDRIRRLSETSVVQLAALSTKSNYYANQAGNFEKIYKEITDHNFVKALEGTAQTEQRKKLQKYFDDCIADHDFARSTYHKYPAFSRNGWVGVREEVGNVPVDHDLSLVIDKKNDDAAYRHLLAHEFMHAHSAKTKGLQEAHETYGEGADEALTETFGRMVTDIIYAKEKGLKVTSDQDKETIAQGVHYNVWPRSDEIHSFYKGGLRYGPELCWFVLAYRAERTPDGGTPSRTDTFPLDLLKAYFITGGKKKDNKSKCPIQIPFLCKRIGRLRARRRNAAHR